MRTLTYAEAYLDETIETCETGMRTRYAYAATIGKDKISGKFDGMVKLDLASTDGSAVVNQLGHGAGRFGGEAVFVSAAGPSGGELSLLFLYRIPAAMYLTDYQCMLAKDKGGDHW